MIERIRSHIYSAKLVSAMHMITVCNNAHNIGVIMEEFILAMMLIGVGFIAVLATLELLEHWMEL